MNLSPEQIAEFERRAAAGEPLVMDWRDHSESSVADISKLSGEMLCVSTSGQDRENWWCNMAGGSLSPIRFHSRLSAKLAAEHLLREACRPLWRRELEELETLRHLHAEAEAGAELMNADKAEMQAEIDRLKARVAELEAALPLREAPSFS